MQRFWSIKTWSIVLLLVMLALGLIGLSAIHRLAWRAVKAQPSQTTENGEAMTADANDSTALFSVQEEAYIWTAVVVALTSLGGVLLILHRHHMERYLLYPMRRLANYLDRVAMGERFLRLPQQQEPALNHLVGSNNILIERFNRFVEESQRSSAAYRQQAQVIINTFSDIAILVNEAGEPVLTNHLIKQLPGYVTPSELLEKLATAISGQNEELQLGDRIFTVIEVLAAEGKGFSGNLVMLREKPASTTSETT